MENWNDDKDFDVYRDIEMRTDGEIYLGIVGPVRTGKSTFIKRFMDLMVLPYMENASERERAVDEMPQSGMGRTITTTEPKFVPKEAAGITLKGGIQVKVRLVDCVGFMIKGANGAFEGETERMVRTPWFEEEIPFAKAAEIGTEKVIRDHSTIGIAVFSDGSFGEFKHSEYREAEDKTVKQLYAINKPFIIVLNSARPYSEETMQIKNEMENKYKVSVIPMNCEQMKETDIQRILKEALYEFPVSQMEFYMPKWVEMLPYEHDMKQSLIATVRGLLENVTTMRQFLEQETEMECPYIENVKLEQVSLADGTIKIVIDIQDIYYYQMLSDMLGQQIENEYQLMALLKEFVEMKTEYVKVQSALDQVRQRGYGVVTPEKSEIILEEPEIIRHGNKYGVKIKAESPSIHMIRANIETEIAPIVGTEGQAKDLIEYIKGADRSDDGIWETNIFGKTVEQLVQDGIHGKINTMGDECQMKLQDTIQRIVNESNGKMICIII